MKLLQCERHHGIMLSEPFVKCVYALEHIVIASNADKWNRCALKKLKRTNIYFIKFNLTRIASLQKPPRDDAVWSIGIQKDNEWYIVSWHLLGHAIK